MIYLTGKAKLVKRPPDTLFARTLKRSYFSMRDKYYEMNTFLLLFTVKLTSFNY